eukprot:COSAG02_NODE_184_length_30545_cov_128.634402_6_plen_48_part_00
MSTCVGLEARQILQKHLEIRFVSLLMPEAMSVDADGGLDSDDDDGDE